MYKRQIFENPPIAPAAEPRAEGRRVVVVKERAASPRARRIDDEALVKIVREADLGDAETIHVYEIDDPEEGGGEVVQVEDTGRPAKVVIVGRADDVTGLRGPNG